MNKKIAAWLLACCALVFAILVQGGVTRLTHSGLSIVEWKPVMGALPPLNSAQWEDAFTSYKKTPEYLEVNAGMDLKSFKSIFWMEYAHRLLARLAGLVFALPLIYLLIRRRLTPGLAARLAALALLWAAQGALGWFMVKSGLAAEPRVSQYRLTAHLLTACLLYSAMLWTALDLLFPRENIIPRKTRFAGAAITLMVLFTIASGGLVAGLKAGFVFNTFPRMAGYWIPPAMNSLEPFVLNLFENVVTVQFDHRLLAGLTGATLTAFCLRGLAVGRSRRARLGLLCLLGATALQLGLGAATLILKVPTALGAAHQAGALILLTAALFVQHELGGGVGAGDAVGDADPAIGGPGQRQAGMALQMPGDPL